MVCVMYNKFEVDKYIGLPYCKDGRSMETGFDCWGLILHLVKLLHNKELPDPDYDISNSKEAKLIFDDCCINNYNISDYVTEIPLENIQLGDLVVIKEFMTSKELSWHIGMFIGNKDVIHCTRNSGVVINKLLLLKPQIVSIHRVK
jgi:cell wall-associated NlpC family hydrolase